VRHLQLPAHWTQRTSLVTDLVACYGCGGRTLVFTETKNDANELASSLSDVVGARCVCMFVGGCSPAGDWCVCEGM
jgi:ATP-dependent RNA helicase DDX21